MKKMDRCAASIRRLERTLPFDFELGEDEFTLPIPNTEKDEKQKKERIKQKRTRTKSSFPSDRSDRSDQFDRPDPETRTRGMDKPEQLNTKVVTSEHANQHQNTQQYDSNSDKLKSV